MDLGDVENKLITKWGTRCPIDSGSVKLELEPDGNVIFHCGWTHKITLEHWVAGLEGVPISQAQQLLMRELGDSYTPHEYPLDYVQPVPLSHSDTIEFELGGNPYWESRGFTDGDQKRFDMGTMSEFPTIVFRPWGGDEILAWVSRNTNVAENTLSNDKYYHHTNTKRMVWGEKFARKIQQESGISWVVLTEGCVDAARFMQAGVPAVATCRPSLTQSQAIRLLRWCQDIIVCPDTDDWGKNYLKNGTGRQYILPFANYDWLELDKKDAGSYTPDELHEFFIRKFPLSGVK